jgi:hypothetical protein
VPEQKRLAARYHFEIITNRLSILENGLMKIFGLSKVKNRSKIQNFMAKYEN